MEYNVELARLRRFLHRDSASAGPSLQRSSLTLPEAQKPNVRSGRTDLLAAADFLKNAAHVCAKIAGSLSLSVLVASCLCLRKIVATTVAEVWFIYPASTDSAEAFETSGLDICPAGGLGAATMFLRVEDAGGV